jgi:hypothetical protein
MQISEGGCLCGAVRYRLSGNAMGSMVCHCQTCRRLAGAPVVAWVTFPKEAFQLTRGSPSEFHSTAPVRRTFCGTCGTPLTYAHENSPTSIDITTCTLDNPASFPPTHHSWLSHDIGWVRFGDGLPTFQQSRHDPAEAIREAYAALNRNDIPGFLAIFDPEIERIEPPGFPLSGTYHGLAAVTAHFEKARRTWAEGSCEPERVIVAGDRVVVLVHVRVRLKNETEWREGRVGDVFTFRNGKVIQFRTFADEKQALEWAGLA